MVDPMHSISYAVKTSPTGEHVSHSNQNNSFNVRSVKNVSKTLDAASRTITKSIRRFIAEKPYQRMVETGSLWKDHGLEGQADIKVISKNNIRGLYQSLGVLSQDESDFLSRFLESKMFATHTTSAPVENEKGIVSLFSREKLIDRGILFNTKNSPEEDISILGNDDFVFFSLEVGETPKKPSSRFGGEMFRFDFSKPSFTDASWLSLAEMRFSSTPHLSRHVQGLTDEEYGKLSKRELPRFGSVFHGTDMKTGIALSLIKDFRNNLSDASRGKLLTWSTDDELNRLVNGMYRPEIKVPRHFFSDDKVKSNVAKDNKF